MHLLNFQIKYFFGENIPTFSVIFNNLLIIFFEIFQIYRNHGRVLETTRFNKKQRAFKEKSSRNNHPRRILQVVIFHVVGGQYSGGNFAAESLPWSNLPWANLPGAIFWGAIFRVVMFQGKSVGGQFSGGNFTGSNFPVTWKFNNLESISAIMVCINQHH